MGVGGGETAVGAASGLAASGAAQAATWVRDAGRAKRLTKCSESLGCFRFLRHLAKVDPPRTSQIDATQQAARRIVPHCACRLRRFQIIRAAKLRTTCIPTIPHLGLAYRAANDPMRKPDMTAAAARQSSAGGLCRASGALQGKVPDAAQITHDRRHQPAQKPRPGDRRWPDPDPRNTH